MRADQLCYLGIAVARPGVVAQRDLILQIFLEMLRHIEGKVADQIVIRPEILVQLQSDQLDVDGRQFVVGQVQAGHVLVVLAVRREGGEGRERVVREVQDGGAGWDSGEISQSLPGQSETVRQ